MQRVSVSGKRPPSSHSVVRRSSSSPQTVRRISHRTPRCGGYPTRDPRRTTCRCSWTWPPPAPWASGSPRWRGCVRRISHRRPRASPSPSSPIRTAFACSGRRTCSGRRRSTTGGCGRPVHGRRTRGRSALLRRPQGISSSMTYREGLPSCRTTPIPSIPRPRFLTNCRSGLSSSLRL